MKIEITEFGKHKGIKVHQFTLLNDNGVVVKLMNYGAAITAIQVPDKEGRLISMACGFDNFEDYFSEEYKSNAPYFGCTVGRYCSQIKNASFNLNGNTFNLAANCGLNNLHGGTTGFDKKVWNTLPFESENEKGVKFSTVSEDMEEGFPGTVNANVLIKLTNSNEIVFEYSGITDKATPLSMTNHTYFNLSGFRDNVEGNWVQVNTNKLLELDITGAATGLVKDVSSTIEDLRNARMVETVHLALRGGFEHFYVFDNNYFVLNKVAEVSDKVSNRKLEVFTTEPCMLFYTGKYTSDTLQRNDSERYGKYMGFCCETHRWPNGPNIAESPGSVLKPDEEFKSTTIFKLSF